MDIKSFKYFKKLYKEIAERKEEGLLKNSSALTIERFNNKFLACYRKLLQYKNKYYSSFVTSAMRRKYLNFVKNGYKESNKGLKEYQVNKLKPKFKEELTNRTLFSLALIKTQDTDTMQKLSSRFLNWLNNETMNGNEKSLSQTLSLMKEQKQADKHFKFILKDQTQKMFCNFDSIIAKECNAIGFFWRTRRDNRVVGNPSGLYPKVKNQEAHGNHYYRQGKFYFYKDTEYVESELFDKRKIVFAVFDDGLPGEPIGCRCYAENVYNLEDVPKKFFSKKGLDYINNL